MAEPDPPDDLKATSQQAVAAGLLAGGCAGLLLGSAEAVWVAVGRDDLREVGLLAWGPVVMMLLCGAFGAGVGLVANRLGTSPAAVSMRVVFFVAGAGMFFHRALIDWKQAIDAGSLGKTTVVAAAIALALAVALLGGSIAARVRSARLIVGSASLAGLLLGFGLLASTPSAPRDYAGLRQVETANLSKRNATNQLKRPDVILIVADTLRPDYLSSYNDASPAKTPGIDGLARDGIRFQNFCAQSSWTKPAFASLMTGLHPRSHTATNRTSVLPSDVTTLGEVFRDAGYYTVGTSNANPNNGARANFDQGFTEWYEFAPTQAWWRAPWSATRMIVYQRLVEPLMRGLKGFRIRHFYAPASDVTNWTLAWLGSWQRPANVPLFLSLHYMDPHEPNLGGAKSGPKMNRGWSKKKIEGAPSFETMRAGYAGDIEVLDAGLAQLFARLRETGLYDEAIVVFTSDHGQELLDHDSWGHGESLYREQTHVPLVVKLPGSASAGHTPEAMASQIDLPKTLLALAGLEVPDAFQGHALLTLDGEVLASGDGHCVASLEREQMRVEAIYRRDSAFIRSHLASDPTRPHDEFFDLAADPAQRENRAGRGDRREAQLAGVLRARIEAAEAARIERSDVELDAGLEAQLRALGYIE
ncbi:MAG: sulfatase [Myxococcota bacterium]|jgi:arylsulfatase A-like enzyme|nr:sulfatase [Myxococcota bacterium]